MGSIMNLDMTDIISKMEGYAVQGIKGVYIINTFVKNTYPRSNILLGSAQNHATRVAHIRSVIREMIVTKLCRWTNCWKHVY
jgi:hypothetical protein